MPHSREAARFVVDEKTSQVLVASLRQWMPETPWSRIRALLDSRRIMVEGRLCLHEGRKLRVGEVVEVHGQALPPPPGKDDVRVSYVDRDLVVVFKPAGMVTLRHAAERHWSDQQKQRQPALEEVVPLLIHGVRRSRRPPLYSVHRIDRDTSGLLVFARSPQVQAALIRQFRVHAVTRHYLAVVPGKIRAQTISSRIVRNRGDGKRGSPASVGVTAASSWGRAAITHVLPRRAFAAQRAAATAYQEIECRLETGRTHQIRIHLAELGHPLCGDTMYRGAYGAEQVADRSDAPRLALHAMRLGFSHPTRGGELEFTEPWPQDMVPFLKHLATPKK